jgi:hypothetical protein
MIVITTNSTFFPIELEINDSTGTARSASHLDLHLEIDNEVQLRTYTLKISRCKSRCEADLAVPVESFISSSMGKMRSIIIVDLRLNIDTPTTLKYDCPLSS